MPDIVPITIAAGVNFTARAWRSEFSGAEWALVLLLRGPAAIDVPSTRDAACHVWDVAGSVTAGWAPGRYSYAVRATNGADVVNVESGQVTIQPDIAAAGVGFDNRSANRIALDAIDAVIAKRATLDQERYRINNRELYRTPIADLLKLRGYYAAQVEREERRAKGGGLFGRQVKFTMGRAR